MTFQPHLLSTRTVTFISSHVIFASCVTETSGSRSLIDKYGQFPSTNLLWHSIVNKVRYCAIHNIYLVACGKVILKEGLVYVMGLKAELESS